MTDTNNNSGGGGGWLSKVLVVILVWVGLAAGAYYLIANRAGSGGSATATATPPLQPGTTPAPGTAPAADPDQVAVGIAYGTEKRRWLEWARDEFEKTDAGKRIDIDLIPMGSVEGSNAVLAGDQRIHVWSPASGLYRRNFVDEWQVRHASGGNDPIAREELLALTPMVFVMWRERYDAFAAKYGQLSFVTVAQALAEPGGWNAIAGRPEWGLFKFGHTHPNQSNSGLMTLVLLAYDYHKKTRGLAMADILDPKFQAWMVQLERGVSGLSNSTGNMMRDMVLRGPSTYDAVFVYENVAIDYLKNAEGRWGRIHVAYPPQNMWNDNPYYVLDVPWSTAEHREAAEAFLAFLLSERVQRQALEHGFRPGNPSVAINTPDSPFTAYADYGLRIDVPSVAENPPPEVIGNLLAGWQRSIGR